jgi:glutamine synthetase
VGDGAANPYLAYAAALAAGLDGMRRKLNPPVPVAGFVQSLPEEQRGPTLPTSFPEAIAALEADQVVRKAVGDGLIEIYSLVKRAELDRFRRWVTDWEFTEYSHHL